MRKRTLAILLAVCCVAGLTLMGCQEEPEPEMTEEEKYWNEYREVMDNYDAEKVVFTINQDLELPYAKARQLDNRSDFRKGLTIHLDTLELTPLTLIIYGTCEYDSATEKLQNMDLYIERLTFVDGTTVEAVVDVPEEEGAAQTVCNAIIYEGEGANGVISENETRILFEQKIEPENVKSITINGIEFPLSGGGQ